MEINEKRLKGILKGERETYQRYLGVVAEDFKSKLQLIAETTGGVQEQLIVLREMVAKNTEDIEAIKADLEIMRMDIGVIKDDLKEKVSRDEFKILERRVSFVEHKLR